MGKRNAWNMYERYVRMKITYWKYLIMDKTWMVGLFSGSMCRSRETASRRGRGTKGNITWTCSSSYGNKEGEIIKYLKE